MDDSEVAALYRRPLSDFTEARDKLAADLARRGEKAAAKEVKRLRKPTVAAWAVNRVAHMHGDQMVRLFELRERMQEAQDATELRRLAAERRALVGRLVNSAGEILQREGHAASAATLDKITSTLQAGDSAEERELLLKGRLSRELSPSGFGDFSLVPAASEEAAPEEDTAARREAEALADAATEAEREAAELERAAAELKRAAARAEEQAQAAARAAAAARRRAEEARDRADEALGV